jgi:protein TonB
MHGTPSPSRWQRFAHAVVVVLGGVGFALATFLVLPLLEAISATPAADLTVVSIDTAALAHDLAQLEMALDPGFGSAAAAGDFAIRIPGIGPGAADQGVDEMFSLADLDQKPRAIVQQQPALTAALKKKMPATVYVLFTVDTDGRVENPVVQSSSDPAFEAPALAAIKQWKFEPGKRSGQPVRFRMRQPMSFQ